MDIGFIGIGRMGSAMAKNLARAGHRVAAYDVNSGAEDLVRDIEGLRWAGSPADAARGAPIVFTSLPGPKEVEQVALGAGGLAEAMQPGSVYVDLSTNSPTVVRSIGAELAKRGIDMLDAPVSGGVEGAIAGTLSVMAGGQAAAFEQVRPVLACIGDRVFYCGDLGTGSVVKLCNNLCGAAAALVLGEALTLGVKAGAGLGVLAEVIGASTGSSRRLTQRFPHYLFRGNFTPGFSTALSAKDTRLALDLAAEYGVPMAMGALVGQALEEALARGWGDLDFDAIVRLQEDRTGIQLRLSEQQT